MKKSYFSEYVYKHLPLKYNEFHIASTNIDYINITPDPHDYYIFKAKKNEIIFNLNEIHKDYTEFLTVKKDEITTLPMKILK